MAAKSEIDLPPQNLEAEKALLGSIFFLAEALDDVADLIKPGHFYLHSNKHVYEAILALQAAGKREFDAITVGEALEAAGKLDEVGGYEYLQEIIESVPHAAHARNYAEQVREKYLRRQVIVSCTDAIRDANDLGKPVDETVRATESELHTVLEEGLAKLDTNLFTILQRALDQATKRESFGIASEFDALDKLTNGWRPGSFVVLAARPSVGKTALLIRWLMNAAKAGVHCLFVSLEQTKMEVAERLLSMQSRVSVDEMRKNPTEALCDMMLKAADALGTLPLIIDDEPGQTMQQIMARSRRLCRREKVGLIAIDYLQIIEPESKREPREQQISGISRSIKRLARELNVPVLCLAQLNRDIEKREGDKRRPKLSDLRDSGSIEQDCDLAMFIDRPATYDATAAENEAFLTLQKNRNGRTGKVDLDWDGPTMTFRPATGSDYHAATLAFGSDY